MSKKACQQARRSFRLYHRNRQVPSFVWASSRYSLWVSMGTRPGARHRDLPAESIETMGYVTTKDGVEIFYKDWGPKNAQPIVFHHGWPLAPTTGTRRCSTSSAKGYRVVAHDRRGHGRSRRSATATTWTTTPPTPPRWSSIST